MKAFLYRVIFFTGLLILVLLFSLFKVKDNVSENNILASLIDKHDLLKSVREEKIVFIGGSNLSFGLNSREVSEAFKKPVINMGIHAGMGLKFIANDIKPFINSGDIVVLVSEYENFYTENFYGEMELVSTLFDIYPAGMDFVDGVQWRQLAKYIPVYSAKKMYNSVQSVFKKEIQNSRIDIYHRRSFNQYGDAYIHWNMADEDFSAGQENTGKEKINAEVIDFLKEFKEYVKSKNAKLLLLPPVIEQRSYKNMQNIINMINLSLKNNSMSFCSEPLTYAYPKDHFFNSYYHLNKKGVDLRTKQVINDLKNCVGN